MFTRVELFSYSDFEQRVKYLLKVREAFYRLRELGLQGLAAGESIAEREAGCCFSLEAEFAFLTGLPLKIECFSTNQQSARWVLQTLMSVLGNVGIKEVFDTYHGPVVGCVAIRDEEETLVEIQ